MMIMKKVTLFAGLCWMIVSALACNKKEQSGDTATLKIFLTDDPANYDAVFIDVQSVEIHSDAGGWQQFDLVHPGIYNLLDFRNGLDTLIADVTLPAGNVSQMRLILGDQNTVVVDGVEQPLATPSAQQSGLKFNIHQNLEPNGVYRMWIDFDAARSIVAQGNGGYSLKPVITTYTEATDGRIKGIALPMISEPVIYAIQNGDTAGAIPASDGFFMFTGMPEGNYHIWIDASEASGYADVHIENVSVTFGQITDLGVTTLLPL